MFRWRNLHASNVHKTYGQKKKTVLIINFTENKIIALLYHKNYPASFRFPVNTISF
ncbi:hypothetical protein SAMN06265171_101945 [Chryseobacterium rhizoplanae]|uniref:Uncharacterized protein n=1 Tax=Chryseobacterium rhizoplanae TaxID=1609531 RepID=A0A521BEF9_9FLAO|nr:hypothetical protein SAMN06265171_101945 [Chryseobacterium rhizoplanae]